MLRVMRTGTASRLAVFVAAILVCGACRIGPEGSSDGAEFDSAGVEIVNNSSDASRGSWQASRVPLLEIGGDASGPVRDLFRVSAAVRLADGRLAVGDGGRRVMLFDASGAHLRTLGGVGEGPGEFHSVDWIAVLRPDSLVVYDSRLNRASIFDADGEFARSISPVPPTGHEATLVHLIGAFGDGTLLGAIRLVAEPPTGGSGIVRPDNALYRLDAEGEPLDSLGVVPGDEAAIVQGVVARLDFLRRTHIAVGRERYHVGPSNDFSLTTYSSDGQPLRIIRLAHEPAPVGEAAARSGPGEMIEVPASRTLPAISGVLLDDDGRLWVEEYRSADAGGSTWWVFDEDGRLLTSVAMPEGLRPLHVGTDAVVGVWRDSLDVEHVRVHALTREAAEGTESDS